MTKILKTIISFQMIAAFIVMMIAQNSLAQTSNSRISAFTTCEDPTGQPSLCVEEFSEEGTSGLIEPTGAMERGCGALSWSRNDYDEVPGIHWAFIRSYCKNAIEITIWSDFETGFMGGSARAKSNGRVIADAKYSQTGQYPNIAIFGKIEANAVLEYELILDEEYGGIAIINGSRYDLANGTLFLSASNGPDIQIKQVRLNLAGLSVEDLQLLATRHPEIQGFYEEFHR